MRVLAVLQDRPRAVLCSSLAVGWHLTAVEGLGDLVEICRADSSYDTLVLGTRSLGQSPASARQTISWLQSIGAPPVVVLTLDDFKSLTLLMDLIAAGLQLEVALWRPNGQVDGLRESIRRSAVARLADRISRLLLRDAIGLSPKWAPIIVDLFRRPAGFARGDIVLSRAGQTVTALNHHLRAAGLRSFRTLRRASRVTQCHSLMRTCSLTAAAAARRAGYGSIDALDRDVKKVFPGATPATLIHRVTERQLTSSMVVHCSRVRSTAVAVDDA